MNITVYMISTQLAEDDIVVSTAGNVVVAECLAGWVIANGETVVQDCYITHLDAGGIVLMSGSHMHLVIAVVYRVALEHPQARR